MAQTGFSAKAPYSAIVLALRFEYILDSTPCPVVDCDIKQVSLTATTGTLDSSNGIYGTHQVIERAKGGRDQ